MITLEDIAMILHKVNFRKFWKVTKDQSNIKLFLIFL
jgi:hypothetical protein